MSQLSSYKNIAQQHYENFPIALWLLPSKQKQIIWAVYAIARYADDVADNPTMPSAGKLTLLEALRSAMLHNTSLATNNAGYLDKAIILVQTDLKVTYYLQQLLVAFQQDCIVQDYSTFAKVLEYCEFSANPIGRILLHVTNNYNENNCLLSDKICTALQLINFLQDIHFDQNVLHRNYIPPNMTITEYVTQTESLLQAGSDLLSNLTGVFKMQIKFTYAAAMTILNMLKKRSNLEDTVRLKPTHLFNIMSNYFKCQQ